MRHGRSASQNEESWTSTSSHRRRGSTIRSYHLNVSPTSVLGPSAIPPTSDASLIGAISIQCVCESTEDDGSLIEWYVCLPRKYKGL